MSAGSNKFGHLFQWSTFGESHGLAMGVVIDGCPAGVTFDEELLLNRLSRRRPGPLNSTSASVVSQRNEADLPQVLSGVFDGNTLGTPIAVVVNNTNQRSEDYKNIKKEARIGHADDSWQKKFNHWDHRGGGRASARETVNWVIAGAFAEMFCSQTQPTMKVDAKLKSVGPLQVNSLEDEALADLLTQAQASGESYGAIIQVEIQNPPASLGEPIFLKMKSELARAFMTINACCGVDVGGGFELALMKGSQVHSQMESPVYGGVRGGISTGENIFCQMAFKPTSSIKDVAKKGRHDPCVALRALPVVEAMTWNVLADQLLMARLNRL